MPVAFEFWFVTLGVMSLIYTLGVLSGVLWSSSRTASAAQVSVAALVSMTSDSQPEREAVAVGSFVYRTLKSDMIHLTESCPHLLQGRQRVDVPVCKDCKKKKLR
jgi:hypothetical protein